MSISSCRSFARALFESEVSFSYSEGEMIRKILLVSVGLVLSISAGSVELVRNGKPTSTVIVDLAAHGGRKGFADADAGKVLVEWVKKITGAELPLRDSLEGGVGIFIGKKAIEAGLTLDAIESPSNEGLRIVVKKDKVLIGGQNPTSTMKAVCRFLEELGCRYLMDGPLGEDYPTKKTLKVKKLTIAESPGFLYRSIWGSTWSRMSLWKIWNGAGGLKFSTGHSWSRYVPPELFDNHPEYFRMDSEGRRRKGKWLCTSNEDVIEIFATNVIKGIGNGTKNPSISPPDGRGFCQCPKCRALDDPTAIEPSSGSVSMSNRFAIFFEEIGKRVAKVYPDSVLSFYCYSDYTQAPSFRRKLPRNLCAWIAPIRYCRYHAIGSPVCPSRSQLKEVIDGWSAMVSRIGYRTYNYNLAECTVPFSKISVWKNDIPYLKEKGCIGINLETLNSWHIYGPHIYLSIRLAYEPGADADAIMRDYFEKFYGPAASIMREYWMGIDEAFASMRCHSGCFFALHHVYTPEFLAKCRNILEKALSRVKDHTRYYQRIKMAQQGFLNAVQYIEIRNAMNSGDFLKARETYEELLARNNELVKKKWSNHYTPGYIRRFIGKIVLAGAGAASPPNRLLGVLPDRWRFTWDEQDQGEARGYHRPDFDDSGWREVATFTDTLDAQGLPDEKTILWYRTRFRLHKPGAELALFFAEVDGDCTVFVNGKKVCEGMKRRRPFEVPIAGAVREGTNFVAVRVDHRKMTELFLGGIIRPVLLIEKPADNR